MIDGTVVNVALARIGHDLDAGFSDLQWTVNAYTLALASLILLGGALGDHFGRRRIFLIGVAWFALASLACGLAPNAPRPHRRPRAAGRRRRAADARQPRPDLRVVPRPGPRGRGRRLVGARRGRGRGRPVPRRMARGVDVAGRLPDQHPARGAGHRRRAAARAGEPRPGVGARSRRVGRGPRRARAGPADLGRSPTLGADGATAVGLGTTAAGVVGAGRVRAASSGARRTRSCRPRCSPTRCSARRTSPRCSSTAR